MRPPRPGGSSVSKNKSDIGANQYSAEKLNLGIDSKRAKADNFAIFSGHMQIDHAQDFEDVEKDDNDSL